MYPFFELKYYREIEEFALGDTLSEGRYNSAVTEVGIAYDAFSQAAFEKVFDFHETPLRILNYCWDLASKSEFFFVDFKFLNDNFPEEWRKPEHIFQGLLDFFECLGIIVKRSTYYYDDDGLVQRPVYTFVEPKPRQIMGVAS